MSVQPGTSFALTLAAALKGQYSAGGAIPLTGRVNSPAQNLKYAFGAGAGLCNQMAEGELLIAPSTAQTLTFGGLENPDGSAFNPARIKVILVLLAAANDDGSVGATSVAVFGAAPHPFQGPLDDATATETVRNGPTGGAYLNACTDATGWPTVAGTSDQLKFSNADATHAATVTYLLLGCDA